MINLTEQSKGHILMLAFSFGIAGSFSLGGMVANIIDPFALTASRFFLATILIGIIVYFSTNLKWEYMQGAWRYFVAGGLMSLYFVLMFIALQTTSAVSTSTVFTLTPLLSGFFGWILLRQKMTGRMAFALGIGAVGAVWVIFRADVQAILQFKVGQGEIIFFFGCLAHAFYTPFLRYANRGEPAQVFVLGMVTTGALFLLAFGWNDIRTTGWQALPPIVWITIIYITLIATILTFFAVSFASMRLPSAKVMAYTYLTPSWVILWEFVLGRGLPSLPILLGVATTIIALLLLLRNDEILG
ncbi:MAG: DMT family transporter [Paracoccaceae bacterium]|nr:DMT family transporter [Paracoccaceae bacterium]MDE2674272.1 DMT family transporter [Paracoccaceae bacterium]